MMKKFILSLSILLLSLNLSFAADDIKFLKDLSISTGKKITLGTIQWNSGDSIDATKVANADLGDVSVSSGVWSVDNNAISYAKMQQVSATSRVLGRITAGAGNVEELTGANLKTIIGDAAADASTKGVATFVANDFTSSSGNIGIDYTNGQAASHTAKGFLTSADWDTFNGKLSSVTAHNLLSATHGDTLADTVTRGDILVGNSTPKWARKAKGSAGQWITFDANDVIYSTATLPTTATSAGKILRADGTNWAASTSTFADTYAINTLLYNASANTVSGLATGNSGVLVTSAGGVPSIATDIPTAVTIGGAYNYRAGGTDVAVADGGSGASSFTAYMPIAGGTTSTAALQSIATGTQYYPLCYNTSSSLPTFQYLRVAGGGTGLTSATAYSLIAGGTTTTGAFQSISNSANSGAVLVGQGSSDLPAFVTTVIIDSNRLALTASKGMPYFMTFGPQQAKLGHLASPAAIEGGLNRWYLLFDQSTDESTDFQFVMPFTYNSNQSFLVKLLWTSVAATSGSVVWNASLMATTASDAAVLETDSFDTVNATTTATNATAAGRVNTTSITMTNKDSVATGDICTLRITRDADNGSDTLAEDARLAGIILEIN